MSKFFQLSKKPSAKIGRQLRSMSVKLNYRALQIILAVLVVFFGLGYLIQVNSLATKGYQIKELENKIAELKQEKSDLELEALSLQSMGSVKERLAQSGMVAAGGSDYLAPTPVALAR